MSKKQRIFYLDFIRVIAILLVIFIHASAIDTTKNIGTGQWQITKILNYFAHISVPLFFMISGTLLLNSKKTTSLSYTWKQRVPRVVIPFVLWSVISPIVVGIYVHSLSLHNVLTSVKNMLHQPTSPTLWFMYPLIGIYILSPIIKTFVQNATTEMLLYVTGIWLVTCSLLPSIAVMLPKNLAAILQLSPIANFFLVGGFTGYFILGYVLTRLHAEKTNSWWLILVFLIFGFAGNFISEAVPQIFDANNGYYVTSIFIPIMSVPAFILLQKWGSTIRNNFTVKTFEFLSPLVFGVYLIHNLLILYIEPFFMSHLPIQGIIATFIRYFAILILSIFIIWILNLIPGLNYLLTGNSHKRK
ncbi:acyltransferase [Lactobacillus halodurans]|uniref:Acyltransferase n=1 Tax=Companilactobacillus halodurans TaxID=2584183 RepID=A0A5P0ZQM1_9LACO|nr:acyltransferase family protein [Companilactobacillus halodurans]MQS76171.1 acyltransferase [Companilactobacillus halodurans]